MQQKAAPVFFSSDRLEWKTWSRVTPTFFWCQNRSKSVFLLLLPNERCFKQKGVFLISFRFIFDDLWAIKKAVGPTEDSFCLKKTKLYWVQWCREELVDKATVSTYLLEADRAIGSSYLGPYRICMPCTPVCQSGPPIRIQIKSLTLIHLLPTKWLLGVSLKLNKKVEQAHV